MHKIKEHSVPSAYLYDYTYEVHCSLTSLIIGQFTPRMLDTESAIRDLF